MVDPTDVVQSATTAAAVITEIEALEPDAGYYTVLTRTPQYDATFVEALRIAEHPVTSQNLLRLVRALLIPSALQPATALLAAGDAQVRAEAADTVGTLVAYSPARPSDDQRNAALTALLARWDIETDDTVRSCLVYALVAFREPRLRRLFESCLTAEDGRIRLQGQSGLDHLDATNLVDRRHRAGTDLQGAAASHQPASLAEIIHRRCCDADPYGRDAHPRRRDIRGVLEHGERVRTDGEHTVTIRGRAFDLVLHEDRPGDSVVHVTDPRHMRACRRVSDHRHRILLQPLSSRPDTPDVFASCRAEMFHDTPSGMDYARDYRTADDVFDGIASKPRGAWFVIDPRTRDSDAAFIHALRRANESHDPAGAELRGILCHILAELKPPDAVDPVTDAATDPDPSVRYEAVRALDRIIGYVPNPPPPERTRHARQVLTDLWHDNIDDDLRSTLAGAVTSFHDPRIRPLLAEHVDSDDPRTRRLCRNGIRYLDQFDPATRRAYTGPSLHGLASGYDVEDLAFLLHRDAADGDPYHEHPHPRERDIAKALRWGHWKRVAGENTVRITGRHIAVIITEDEPSRWSAAFLNPIDPGLPPCRLPWHRRVSVGFSSTAIGTDGRIVSGPNNTGRTPRSG